MFLHFFPHNNKIMLLKFRNPFKVEDQKENHHHHHHHHKKMNRSSILGKETKCGSHERSNSNPVGLRILVEISTQGESNYVVKSAPRISTQPTRSSAQLDNCFLKTCNLCNKGLSLDKEVYMYRGDQGFCSIECRDRQIYLDEIKDLEASTKKMIASYRNSCINDNPSRHEPRRHKPISYNNPRTNHPLVIS